MASAIDWSRDPLRAARARLTARFFAIVAMLLLVGGVGVYAYVRHVLHEAYAAADALAVRSLLETRRPTGNDVVGVDPALLDEEYRELAESIGVVAVELWAADGRALGQWSMHSSPIGLRSQVDGLRVQHATWSSGVTLVVARHAEDAGELDRLGKGLLLALPFVLLAAVLAGAWLAGHALRPIRVALERQRAFMSDASHELRTPLAVIRAHAEVAIDAPSRDAALRTIARTASDMGEWVGDMLLLSRIDGAPHIRAAVELALDELVDDVVVQFAPVAAAHACALRWSCPDESHMVRGDPSMLARMIGVLLDNAIHHGGPGQVVIELSRAGARHRLDVRDYGLGISEELRPRVFERFVRGEDARAQRAGAGLGLAIARAVAHEHGGTIALESAAPGTRFTVVLPVASLQR